MRGAGELRNCVSFYSPTQIKDDYGGHQLGWKKEFTVRAAVHYLRGSEPVMAARLEGKRPAIFTIRKNPATARIKTDWKLHFDNEDWNINEKPAASESRSFFEFMATSGVAV